MYNPFDFYGYDIASSDGYDSIWNPWQKSYNNTKVNVTFNMKVKNNDIQSQDSESTRTKDRNDKSKEILRNARGK